MKDLKFEMWWGDVVQAAVVLDYSPDGWDDNSLTVERSSTYYGIFRSYTIKLKFVKDGAKLLRSIFYDGATEYQVGNSIACKTKLKVFKLNVITLVYELIYEGQIDYSTFSDQKTYVEVAILDSGLSNLIKANQDNEYEVEFETAATFQHPMYPNTRVEFLYFSTLLEQIFDKLTEGGYSSGKYNLDTSALSMFQSGAGLTRGRYCITNHSGLKGLGFKKAKTTFKNILKTLFTICKITGSIEKIEGKDTFVLYDIADVFPNEIIYSTDNVTDFKVSVASDYMYGRLLCGHPTQEYDNSNKSAKEYNVTTEFRIPNLQADNELELVTAYRADMAGINLSMSDIRFLPDEEELFICTIQNVAIPNQQPDLILQPGTVKQEGVLFASGMWNCRISPKRIAVLHEAFINSVRYGAATVDLKYVGSFFNNSINYTLPSENTIPVTYDYIHEGSGYSLQAAPIFKPLYIEFSTDMPREMIELLSANPYGKIQFTFNGNTFAGFLINVSIKLHGRSTGKLKLLSAPENDLTKLIH